MEIVTPLAQNEGIECGAVVFFMALIIPAIYTVFMTGSAYTRSLF